MTDTPHENQKLEAVASFADDYQEHDLGFALGQLGLEEPRDLRKADQWMVLKFVLRFRVFEDQAAVFDKPALDAIEELEPTDEIDPDELWAAFKPICQEDYGYALFPEKTKSVLEGTAKLYNTHGNFIDWIADKASTKDIDTVYDEFTGIKYVGPKISKFIIRDFVWLLDKEDEIPDHHHHYLHPIDGWVRSVSETIWPHLKGEPQDQLSHHLAERCQEYEVSHIRFNQGAFYFGGRIVGDDEQIEQRLTNLLDT